MTPTARQMKIFGITEWFRRMAGSAWLLAVILGITWVLFTHGIISGLRAILLPGGLFIGTILIMGTLGLLDLMERFNRFAAAPFLRQIPDEIINARIDEAFTLIMGWYETTDGPPDRVITFMPVILLGGSRPQLTMRIWTSYAGGNRTLEGAFYDADLQRAIREILTPRGATLYQLRAMAKPVGDNDPCGWVNEQFVRKGVLTEMPNHARISSLAAYRKIKTAPQVEPQSL